MSDGLRLVIFFVALFIGASVFAKCRTEQVPTSYGSLDHVVCRDEKKIYTHSIYLEGSLLLEADFLAEEGNNGERSVWVYSGKSLPLTGCPDQAYLIDLSLLPVKVFSFGVKKACNEFLKASWGAKRSVIALKKNVSFIYENGKLIPPKAGEQLWKSIEPPHAGPGLKLEDAQPFVEELALPSAN
jgi:hypothetical protein